jgi:hypothetical protein
MRHHTNVLGRYRFECEAAELGERLRPLNQPDASDRGD